MRKIVAILILLCVINFGLIAQLSLGISGGVSYLLNTIEGEDSSTVEVNKISVPLSIEGGYVLSDIITLPKLGAVDMTVGLRSGYMYLYGIKVSAVDRATVTAIPLYVFSRAESGILYVDVAAGVSFWNVDATFSGEDKSDQGVGFSFSCSPGLRFPVREHISVRAGLSYTLLNTKLTTNAIMASYAGALLGLSLEL